MERAPLESVREQVGRCNRCGFCQAACPVYHATGREAATARGHNELVRQVLAGDLDLEGAVEPSFAGCLLCRACTAHCFPALPTERVVTAARAAFNRKRAGARVEERLMRSLLGDQRRMARAMTMAYLGKRSGLLRLLGWVPWLPRGLAEAGAIMPDPPRSFLRERLASLDLPPAGARGTVTYFVGCGMNFGFPDAAAASLRLLAACGYGVRAAENICCGLPAYTHGHPGLARDLAAENVRRLAGEGIIVTDCSSCASFLKQYPEILGDRDGGLAARVRDLCEVIEPAMLSRARLGAVATFHQPCHLGRYQGLAERPQELLEAVPGLEFRPLREADWCCGGAGTYVVSQYDMSMRVLERKAANIAASGAETLTTSCPACMAQLRYGVRRFGSADLRSALAATAAPPQVRHLSQVLCAALERRG